MEVLKTFLAFACSLKLKQFYGMSLGIPRKKCIITRFVSLKTHYES